MTSLPVGAMNPLNHTMVQTQAVRVASEVLYVPKWHTSKSLMVEKTTRYMRSGNILEAANQLQAA